ncbi:MAG: glycosyltransferase, partial [Liquorilactobacillus nagelii]|uniref:glycosyltransferase n=1 Tax=Liquorilactobacillus nagelii TaxID=82688 RepID=UPI0039E9781C
MKINDLQPKVAIMMATYNGQKYLDKQIDSILDQTYHNWELFISDDKSKDETLEILKKYQKKDSRIKKIIVNNGVHGSFTNF